MCGRFVRQTPARAMAPLFDLERIDAELEPSYNVAPSQDVLAVVDDGVRRLRAFRWGLVPFWAEEPAIGSRMINARAETAAEKPSFRQAFRQRRCLVVADGFYEWRKDPQGKTPVYIHLRSGQPFGLAGLYERWHSPEGELLETCTILTTAPNHLLRPIHNRMPVILPREHHGLWLDPSVQDPQALQPLLRPYDADAMAAYDVSRYVNSPRNDGPRCIEPSQS
ncbi:MAG: SOS response-associated peptidase [Chloroflexia bacterium]|nr:SOS response-associated peptidase [Chloroflexia bacterium]